MKAAVKHAYATATIATLSSTHTHTQTHAWTHKRTYIHTVSHAVMDMHTRTKTPPVLQSYMSTVAIEHIHMGDTSSSLEKRSGEACIRHC